MVAMLGETGHHHEMRGLTRSRNMIRIECYRFRDFLHVEDVETSDISQHIRHLVQSQESLLF